MKISECVGFLESQVEKLKAREAELMQRTGALLERARKAEQGPELPSQAGTTSIDNEVLEYLVAADNLVVMLAPWPHDPRTRELVQDASGARSRVVRRVQALRTQYATRFARDAACKSTS